MAQAGLAGDLPKEKSPDAAQAPVPDFSWSWKRDSNTRPAHYECAALPTELFQQILILYEYIDFDLKIQLKYGKIYLGIFIIIGLKSTILL